MKALLLAAGRGTRISRYLNGNPKCTVDLGNGVPLIEYTVEILKKKGIREIAIVTGYRHEALEQLLQDKGVRFYFNPFFDVTNSIASAWFAKDFLGGDDMLLMNADVFCEETLYDFMLSERKNPVMFYDTGRREEADYKFFCPDGKIRKYGKELPLEQTSGEYVGIARMSREFMPCFVERLDEMIKSQQHSVWWENVLYSMAQDTDILVSDTAPMFWAEVDYIEDYERIQDFVKNSLK